MGIMRNLFRNVAYVLRLRLQHIRTELLLSYSVIILMAVSLVGAVSYHYTSRSVISIVENANKQIINQVQQNLDHDFRYKRSLLLAPYFDPSYISGINSYVNMDRPNQLLFNQKLGELYLKSFYVSPQTDFIGFSIYYKDGNRMYASGNAVTTEALVTESEWFRRTVARNGKVYFSGAYSDEQTGQERFSASLLIRDFTSEDRYVIVRAEYNFRLLRQISQNSNVSSNTSIVILDGQGLVAFKSENESADVREAATEPTLLEQVRSRITGDAGAFWHEQGAGGRKQVTYLQSDQADWTIVLVTPERDISGAAETIKAITITTVAIAVVIASLISVLFARRITTPVLQLYRTVKRIKRGELSIRADVHARNELGRIAEEFNAMVDELQTLIRTKYVYRIKLREAELAMLHSQINPHFLYNTLDSIRAMSEYYNVKDVALMAGSLADMFRYNTHNDEEWSTVREEIAQVHHYLTIQKIRFGEKIKTEIDVDERLGHVKLLKMTLQPLVENAMFHGLERKKGGGTLRIGISRQGEFLHLEVDDDGVGMPPDQLARLRQTLYALHDDQHMQAEDAQIDEIGLTRRRGIGLANVYARYAIRFGDQLQFHIDSEHRRGTTVSINLPYSSVVGGAVRKNQHEFIR